MTDEFIWLEDVHGTEAMDWVSKQNRRTLNELEKHPSFSNIEKTTKQILLAADRLAQVTFHGGYLYNFWQDEKNPRGVWRRASPEQYRMAPSIWQTIIDIDKLAQQENEDWVFKGFTFLGPADQLGLMWLSHGGLDACVGREFNLNARSFVENGFYLPNAKTDATWVNADTLLIATDFGPGSTTSSGYARMIKEWKRGTALDSARTVLEIEPDDMACGLNTEYCSDGNARVYLSRVRTFYSGDTFVYENGNLHPIAKPHDAEVVAWFKNMDILRLRGAWHDFRAGSVVALPIDGKAPTLIFSPSERQSVNSVHRRKDDLIIGYLDSVQSRTISARPADDGSWRLEPTAFPQHGTLTVTTTDVEGDLAIATYMDFLTPPSIIAIHRGKIENWKSLQQRFDPSLYQAQQLWFNSKDGTEVPYFLISPKELTLNGENPVLIYGYGGFEVSYSPDYRPLAGKLWLERGGSFVYANIRGGGEFGPHWHQSALKQNRQRAFDDFQGIAEDLIRRKITKPKKIAIQGRSNGGLLVGTCFTQRPELYGAVVCGVPLLDMIRYNKLLAGASWMAEYGNPDVDAERHHLEKYSPYQNLRPDKEYPDVFFYTATTDDRVHPGHARKMAAKMEKFAHRFLYFENTTGGGHAGSADPGQEAQVQSYIWTFLHSRLLQPNDEGT